MRLEQMVLFGVIMAYFTMMFAAFYFFRNAIRYKQYRDSPEGEEGKVELRNTLYTVREQSTFLNVVVVTGVVGFVLLLFKQAVVLF